MIEENMLRGSLVSSNEAKGGLGFKGERGYSAYEIAVQNGYEGTEQEWIDHFGLDLTDYVKTSDILDLVYPVGSLYMSVNSTSPATLFGGTWEQIKDTFLLSAGDTYTAGATGGSATHTLTTNELPNISGTITLSANIVKNDNTGHLISGATGVFERHSNNFVTSVNTNVTNPTHWYYNEVALNVGGGQAHSIMPPYLAVYVWKRTG